jgi:hypothetical protein
VMSVAMARNDASTPLDWKLEAPSRSRVVVVVIPHEASHQPQYNCILRNPTLAISSDLDTTRIHVCLQYLSVGIPTVSQSPAIYLYLVRGITRQLKYAPGWTAVQPFGYSPRA